MKIRILGLLVGLGALATWATACEQPAIDCRAARGSFAATYKLKTGMGPCAELKGEVIGLQSYYPASADKKSVDLSKSTLAIRSESLALLADEAADLGVPDETNPLNSVGNFESVDPDDSGICSASGLNAAEQKIPAIPADPMDPMSMEIPARNVKYEWRNVRLFVTAAAPGNRMTAELTYTENDCTATYDVVGLWPATFCGEEILDADGEVVDYKPNDGFCDDKVDSALGETTAAPINPDFPVRCDPDLLLCVLTETPQ